MSGSIKDIKDILSIKIKPRHDAYSDQYSRVFMMKMLLIGALIVGLNWFNDKITCIVPGSVELSSGFVGDACWIQGFYIYQEVDFQPDSLGYYGIPVNIDFDGKYENGKFCAREHDGHVDELCNPMKKTFYLQYQYMPFFLAALAAIYYLPYVVFKIVNTDIISLKDNIKSHDAKQFVETVFNPKVNKRSRQRIRVIVNIIIKLLYIASNIIGFVATNKILYGNFSAFGSAWIEWSGLTNELAHDYHGKRDTPKPGNKLLPTFGVCEVQEGARDERHTIINTHKFICEYSQNILYHYVMIVLWYIFVMGIFVSILGFFIHIIDILVKVFYYMKEGKHVRKVYKKLTLRETEYLDFIRRKNLVKYGEILSLLAMERLHENPDYMPLKPMDDGSKKDYM